MEAGDDHIHCMAGITHCICPFCCKVNKIGINIFDYFEVGLSYKNRKNFVNLFKQ